MGSGATHNVLEENKNGENEYVKYDAPTTELPFTPVSSQSHEVHTP